MSEKTVSPLVSLVQAGTKLWIDSIDPTLVQSNRKLGATGATSNPVIVADLLNTGRFDQEIGELIESGKDDETIAWEMTDRLVRNAQTVFQEVWEKTAGNDGYVSFELDPLIEDTETNMPHEDRVARYIELGKKWSAGHTNRMIKVPATPAGLAAVEELAANNITLNVTLIFSDRQYQEARDRIWSGAQRAGNLDTFKSVYSIFVSRVDVYTQKHVPELSADAQGQVGIVNAKRIWAANKSFWSDKGLALQQELIFASTGVKDPNDDPCRYIKAFAGSDIETNPPGTNQAAEQSGEHFTRQIDALPAESVLAEIDQKVDFQNLETVLMQEGLQKFADPQKALIKLIGEKRSPISVG